MGLSFTELWTHMGWPAITVAVVLLVMGLASLTVFIERNVTLRRSRPFSSRTARLLGPRPKIVMRSSGIGSWRSRMTFAPRAFGTRALKTSTSGMLWT